MFGLSGIERRKQRVVVDHTAATDIDQYRPGLHGGEEIRIDHIHGLDGLRHAEHDHVAVAEMVE